MSGAHCMLAESDFLSRKRKPQLDLQRQCEDAAEEDVKTPIDEEAAEAVALDVTGWMLLV